jgi:hypothetical protein
VTLTAGQTFVEVVEPSYGISIRAGHLPPPPPMHPGGLSPT